MDREADMLRSLTKQCSRWNTFNINTWLPSSPGIAIVLFTINAAWLLGIRETPTWYQIVCKCPGQWREKTHSCTDLPKLDQLRLMVDHDTGWFPMYGGTPLSHILKYPALDLVSQLYRIKKTFMIHSTYCTLSDQRHIVSWGTLVGLWAQYSGAQRPPEVPLKVCDDTTPDSYVLHLKSIPSLDYLR